MMEVKLTGTLLRLIIKGEYRDKEWGDNFGEIQRFLREKRYKSSPIATFVIDLVECRWADPIPLLATFIAGAEFRMAGGDVDIYIPLGSVTEDTASRRFLKFLAQEGFLSSCLSHQFNIYDQREELITQQTIPELARSEVDLAYQNSTCIPAEIINLVGDSDAIENACERLLKLASVDLVIREKVPAWARERIEYKLNQVLFECLSNVHEHAYQIRTAKLCGIYVRYRAGALGLPQDQQDHGDALRKSESLNCPRLDREFLDTTFGAFEVFVIDAGIGLVKSLEDSKSSIPDVQPVGTYPFQWMAQLVFGKPIAKRKKAKTTEYGGLYLIHQLLSTDRDYVRGFDDRTWIGDFVPTQGLSQHILASQHYQGLIWHFRLGWNDKTDVGEKWQTISEDNRELLLDALRDNYTYREKTKEWWCIDQRFSFESPYARGRFEKNPAEEMPSNVMWLVPPNLTKKDIYARLEGKVMAAGNPRTDQLPSNPRTLFIADIPVHEAETYVAAFDNASIAVTQYLWATKVDIIVLVSRHWAYCVLRAVWDKKDHSRNLIGFLRDESHFEQRVSSKPLGLTRRLGPLSPSTYFPDLVRWIKWHDSERFWDSLSKHPDDLSYIPDPIAWGVDQSGRPREMKGYLDFSQALADPVCRALLRVCASRLPGIVGSRHVTLRPLDSLTKTIADDLQWSDPTFSSRQSSDSSTPVGKETIILGSVVVTGSTERALVSDEYQLAIHFFKHPQAVSEKHLHLLHWPKADSSWFKELFEPSGLSGLRRIGSTSAIAEGGWKYFEVPRYDKDRKLLAARAPDETYADWQRASPVIVKTGHWSYESKHDLLTVNLALALREAFHRRAELACYLVFNLFKLLGIEQNVLTNDGRVWWDHIFDPESGWLAQVEDLASANQYLVNRVEAVIYPSHHNTELMIERFLSLIATEHVRSLRKRLLPIRNVRGRHSGSANLILPLTLVRLERILANSSLKTVAYLDDAIITGRTLREASNAVAERGGQLSQAIVLLDRQRMPAEGDDNFPAVRHFWRLDVPVMGSDRSCPLCSAISMVQAFSSALASQRAKRRVLDWVESWKVVSPSLDWTRGLHPVPLGFSVEKRFSLRRGETLGGPIRLTRSTGLTAWVSELHAMTCEDALASAIGTSGLNKQQAGSQKVPPDALIELLATQVLLFGDEYSNEELQKILLMLFETAMELKGKGDHTALAVLALISKSDDVIRTARKSWQERLTKWSPQLPEMPEDLQIAIAFLLHLGLVTSENRVFRDSERLLSSRASKIADKYSQLHYEVFDYDGNQHSGPLSRVAQWGPQFSHYWLILALNSIDKLLDLAAEIESDTAYVPKNGQMTYAAIRLQFKEALAGAKHLLEEVLENIARPDEALPRNAKIIDSVNRILELGRKVHRCFFFDIGIDQLAHRIFEEEAIAQVFGSAGLSRAGPSKLESKEDTFEFSRSLQPKGLARTDRKCVCWDQEIVTAIADLARNCKDARAINDPWNANVNEAKLWVRVDYRNEGVSIKLANSMDSSINQVRQALALKARTRWNHIFLLGGRVFPPREHEQSNEIVVIEVQLPFAGYLVAEKYLAELEAY